MWEAGDGGKKTTPDYPDMDTDLEQQQQRVERQQRSKVAGTTSLLRQELLATAFALVVATFPIVATEFVQAFAIPSRSMDTTLKVGDVVLGEKLSSMLGLPLERGDLVFFSPPRELEDIVASTGGRVGPRDRFVKRVAAVAGDVVALDESGRAVSINGVPRAPPPLACTDTSYDATTAAASSAQGSPDPSMSSSERAELQGRVDALLAAGKVDQSEAAALLREVAPPDRETAEGAVMALRTRQRVFGNVEARVVDPQQLGTRTTIPEGSVFVLGDCEARSTDSRVWGPLAVGRVSARPVVRIWPPERAGAIDTTADLNPFRRELLRFRYALDAASNLGPRSGG